jgi:caffeoyl-CoA O-methyltransferase
MDQKSLDFSKKAILHYCERFTTPPGEVLYQLERETFLKTLAPQMMSGHLQGALLRLISQLAAPQRILEIGTFTGYATICLAAGLRPDGILHTIEANPELQFFWEKYFPMAGIHKQVQTHIGDAKKIIKGLAGPFDLVFIDAGKLDYALYYDLVIDKLNPGGLILADNVLWSGKVAGPEQDYDMDTATLHAFNKKVQEDQRVENVLLPIRDGLIAIRKR